MKGAFQIAKVKGIRIFIHWTFFILLLWIAFSKMNSDHSAEAVFQELVFILCVFFCVLLHELGHALTAARYHIVTRDITLLPIGGVARLERMPEEPAQELKVAIAGPLVNVAIVLVLGIFIFFGKGFPLAVDLHDLSANGLLLNLVMVNLSLIIFNMIPAFPMDGGRVLRALLAMKWPREKATRMAASLGQFIAVLFVLAGLFYNPFLILIGVFVFLGAQAEYKMTLQQSVFKNIRVKNLIIRNFTALAPSNTFQEAVDALLAGYVTDFLIVSDDQPLSFITRDEILQGYSSYGPASPIIQAGRPAEYSASEEDSLEKVWMKMVEQDLPLVPVYREGRLIGILTRENIAEFMALHVFKGQ